MIITKDISINSNYIKSIEPHFDIGKNDDYTVKVILHDDKILIVEAFSEADAEVVAKKLDEGTLLVFSQNKGIHFVKVEKSSSCLLLACLVAFAIGLAI